MSDEETNTLHAAIIALYGIGGEQAGAASAWLADFQKTMGAWTACDRLLREQRDAVSVCFAAQTLRQKILKNLKELPPDSLLSLRESLTRHLAGVQAKHYDQLVDVTTTQLCLAIADLYIQVHEWNNWIAELLNTFTSMDGDRTRILLVLLRVFPEEIDSIGVGENRRHQVREEIAMSAHSVLMFLSHVLEHHGSTADEDFIKKVVSCLAAYLTNPSMNTDELADSQLLGTVFHMLYAKENVSSSLHSAATECIVNALFRVEDTVKHLPLARSLHRGVQALREPFNRAVEDEDLDRLMNYGRIFVEMAESFLEYIVNGPNSNDKNDLGTLDTLNLLLLLAHHHDYSLIEMTFHIWYRISEALFQIDNDDHVAQFAPYVTEYLQCLFKHVRYETDMLGLPSSSNELADFREKAAESVKDVVYIVGTDKCVVMMFELMVECSAKGASWDETEAALFITSNVISNLLPDVLDTLSRTSFGIEDDCVVPDLLRAITSLPPSSTHPALLLTCTQLLGSVSDWLQKHPEFQEPSIGWISELIVNPQFASPAGEALSSICSKCASPLASTDLIDRFFQLIPSLEITTTNSRGVESGITYILRSATQLIMMMNENDMSARLNTIGQGIMQHFKEALSNVNQKNNNKENIENLKDAWSTIKNEPLVWVDRISAVFREVQPWIAQEHGNRPAPWLELAHVLWDPLSHSFKLFEDNSRIVEHICRALRFLVRSLGIQSQGFVQPLVSQMVDVYKRHSHSCILYLSSVLVDEYGGLDSMRPGLLSMLETLATRSFADLNLANGLRDNPDTVDDLFRLSSRFVQRAPSQFFQHPICNSIFDCSIAALTIEHQDANRSVTRFICNSLDQLIGARNANYRDAGVETLERIIQEKGEKLIGSSLHAGVIDLPSHLRRDQADILNLIAMIDRTHFTSWIQCALSTRFSQTPPCPTNEQLTHFLHTISTLKNAREMYVLMRDFARMYA